MMDVNKMTKKQKLKYLLNASNRHEAILGEIRDDIDTIDSSITILHAKIEALEQKSLSEPKLDEDKDLDFATVNNVVSKLVEWCLVNRNHFYGKDYILYDELMQRIKRLQW
jgi:NifB/MoaA-like Fe-S oxidoreductase